MPTDGKFPGFVRIGYTSLFGVHYAELKTRAIESTGLGDPGTVLNWSGVPIPVDVMVEDMLDAFATAVPSSIVYNNYEVFRVPEVNALPEPIFSKAVSVAGTETGLTGQSKAVQMTVTLRTAGFSVARLVFLDRQVNGSFGKFLAQPADLNDMVAEFTSVDNAWAGMDNTRPQAFLSVVTSLNKRLRRKYGML